MHSTSRIASAWIVLLLAGTDAFAQSASATPGTRELLAAGEPVTIVCFGDSITGVYYHTGGRRAYPEMLEIALRKEFPRAHARVVNAGVSGNTTREALQRIDRDVLKHKPQLVTVMFGMNDMVRVPLDEFKKNIAEITDRCRKAGAEVLFCTQNNVIETAGRPNKKLAEITQVIRDLAREVKVGVADCHAAYEAANSTNAGDWRLMLSDEIHPNMDGHKLMAEVIARAVLGKEVSLRGVGPPWPAIPRTLQLLKSGQPIRVLAMPPYDKVVAPAIQTLHPKATVEVTSWPTEGLTLAQLEAAAKKVRAMKLDLVMVAVPMAAGAPDLESRIRSYSWVLNWSLSFGVQQWDVIAVPPSTAQTKLSAEELKSDAFARRLIAAQDLGTITRNQGEEDDALQAVIVRWLKAQAEPQAPARFILEWGGHGKEPGQFDVPIGIAVTANGDVLVSDFYNARVQRFNPDGKLLVSFPVLPNPGGMALDENGNIYLTHFTAMRQKEEKKPDRLTVYDAKGKLLRQWGKTGTGDGEFDYPGGIVVSKTGRVYVADQTNRRVQVFDRDGKFLFKWGKYGVKEGEFGGNVVAASRVGGPQFIALDEAGHVYTTEGSVGRVQKFTADGKFLAAWGDNDDKPGSFGGGWMGAKSGLRGPMGICVDAKGRLWVGAVSGRVQLFTNDGKFLGGVGRGGSEPGEFLAPHGIALDGRGHLYVVDALNHRVQKLAIDR